MAFGMHGRKPWAPGVRFLIAAFYGSALFLAAFPQHYTAGADFWVRLASGRYVLDNLAIPRHDPFSYTALGHSWLDHEWALSVVMYLL